MKRLVCIAAAAAFAFATSAGAQGAKPPASKAPASKPTTVPKPQAQAQKSGKQPPAAAHKSRRNEDARACLQRGSNTEIIKCAEAYL
jgi:hypothetical protein